MAQANRLTDDQRQRLNDRHETLLRSMILLRGDKVSPAQISLIVGRATKAATPEEAHSLAPSTSAANLLQQFLKETVETDGQRRPTNIYSAEGARAEQMGRGPAPPRSGIDTDRLEQSRLSRQQQQDAAVASPGAADRASSSSSGARYDNMASLDWSSPAGLARMRGLAIQSGVPWAANNPELLRLGPAAIGALAEVHFKQETYKRLTTDASFKAKDVVVLARFAKEQHVDANKLGTSFGNAEKDMTPQERERLNGAVVPYMADAKNPQRQAAANNAFDEAEKAHPEKLRDLESLREQVKLKKVELHHENKAADEKGSRAVAEASRTAEKGSRAAQATTQAVTELAKFDALDAGPKTQAAAPAKDEKPKVASAEPSAPPAKPPSQKAPAPHKLG